MRLLMGKVAVVTGGSAGIGLAIASRFVAEGAHVFVTGRSQEPLDAAVRALGPAAVGVRGDASSLADLDLLRQAIVDAGRAVDVLVANAGTGAAATIDEATPEQFDMAAGLTFRGTFFTVQKILPVLNDGAAIVLIGSIAGGNGTPGASIYNASKAAVRSLARSLTAELGPRGIRVNTLSPGPTQTAGFDQFAARHEPGWLDQIKHEIPLRRIGQPEEVASAALFLASEQSSFISGVELVIDGGLSQV